MSRLLSCGRAGYISYDLQNALELTLSHQIFFRPYPTLTHPIPPDRRQEVYYMYFRPSPPNHHPEEHFYTYTLYLRILSGQSRLSIVSIFTC